MINPCFLSITCYVFTWSWNRDGWSSDRWLSVELFPSSELSWIRITSWPACYLWGQRYSAAGFSPTQVWIHLRPSFYGGNMVQISPWRSGTGSLTWRCWRSPPPPWEFRTGRRRPSPCGNELCCLEPSQPTSKYPHSSPSLPVCLLLPGSPLEALSPGPALCCLGHSARVYCSAWVSHWYHGAPVSGTDTVELHHSARRNLKLKYFLTSLLDGGEEGEGGWCWCPTWTVVHTRCPPCVELPILVQAVSHVG